MATTIAISTPATLSRNPEPAPMGPKRLRPANVPESTVMPTKEPIMKLSPWAKLMSSMIP
jgi:hypothetical protein